MADQFYSYNYEDDQVQYGEGEYNFEAMPQGPPPSRDTTEALENAAREYFQTGCIVDPECAAFFRKFFGAFVFGSSESPPLFGSSEVTASTNDVHGKLTVEMEAIMYSMRIPKKSVLPVEEPLGITLTNFLEEIGQNIPEFVRDQTSARAELRVSMQRDAELQFRREAHRPPAPPAAGGAPPAAGGAPPAAGGAPPAAGGAPSDAAAYMIKLQACWNACSPHAPWAPLKFEVESGIRNQYKRPVDLTSRQDVYSAFITAYRSSRLIGLLREQHPQQDLVTLVFETEADVWAACGGHASRLPPNTWITLGNALGTAELLALDGDGAYQDHFANFVKEADPKVPEVLEDAYLGSATSMESQLYAILKDKLLIKQTEKSFHIWTYLPNSRKMVPLSMTSVLRLGGHDELNLQEHADKLVMTAMKDGYIDCSGGSVLQQLILQNRIPEGHNTACKWLKITNVDINPPDEAESSIMYRLVNQFRRGKDKVLQNLTSGFGKRLGGERALLVVDAEYRRHFIALCRANYQLKQMTLGPGVMSDRRRRLSSQQQIRRESLHFFQVRNGTGTRISSQFLTR
jgi:hypothetical protein